MKVCYVISCMKLNTGLGGHYHSLKATAEALSKEVSVLIIIVGNNPCPTIEQSGLPYERIPVTYNIIGGIKHLIKSLKAFKPDVLHSFDNKADFFARSASNYLKIPKINTKCGGASPNKYYPDQKNLIIYSREDFGYFSKNEKFKDSNVYLIPNRVVEIIDDEERIKDVKKNTKHKTVFLRISRIGDYYKKSLIQAINLIKWLTAEGSDAELIILGKIESEAIYNELKEYASGERVTFVTDPRFTSNASQLIGVSDAVIGTGRGIMEAASKGKILLTPLKGSKYPVLVTGENFDELFHYNFSERNKVTDYDEAKNLSLVKEIIGTDALLKDHSKFIKQIYTDNFSIDSKIDTYLNIYKSLKYSKDSLKDYLLHFIILVRFYLK